VDIPGDVQLEDETGSVWAFLDAAHEPSRILPGAIGLSGDARVVSVPERRGGTEVHLQIPPVDPLESVDVVRRSHLVACGRRLMPR
jgi:hypothetical protein